MNIYRTGFVHAFVENTRQGDITACGIPVQNTVWVEDEVTCVTCIKIQTEGYDGPEKWVPEAIAQQEEYLKRRSPCSPERWPYGANHSWEHFSLYPRGPIYEACFNCGVTKTDEDYQKKFGVKS